MKVHLIRTDGSEETHDLAEAGVFAAVRTMISAGDRGLDHVNLRDGRVMLVDGNGYETKPVRVEGGIWLKPIKANKPVNPKATALYHATRPPGEVFQIADDVAIVNDNDFAE